VTRVTLPDSVFGKLAREVGRAGVTAGAIAAQAEIKLLLSRPGTGRVYARRSKGAKKRIIGYHVASAPGNPPAAATGQYRRSVQVDLSGASLPTPVALVGTNDRRGPWLELGTRRMRARPHFAKLPREKVLAAMVDAANRALLEFRP
jgi:hypothetical protein